MARKKEKEEAATGVETEESTRGGGGSTKSTEAPNWEMVVELMQMAFREGRLAEEAI